LVTTRAPMFFARIQSAALLMLASGAIVVTSVPFRFRTFSMIMASSHRVAWPVSSRSLCTPWNPFSSARINSYQALSRRYIVLNFGGGGAHGRAAQIGRGCHVTTRDAKPLPVRLHRHSLVVSIERRSRDGQIQLAEVAPDLGNSR